MGRIPMGAVPKTERLAIFVTPRTRVDLLKVAAVQRTSLNMIVNNAVAEYIDKHGSDIQRFNDFFGEDTISNREV